MKTEIPDALKQGVPQTMWGKILVSTPVVMTVVATLLAGLASSEMTGPVLRFVKHVFVPCAGIELRSAPSG